LKVVAVLAQGRRDVVDGVEGRRKKRWRGEKEGIL
jgi:hypothetical protein